MADRIVHSSDWMEIQGCCTAAGGDGIEVDFRGGGSAVYTRSVLTMMGRAGDSHWWATRRVQAGRVIQEGGRFSGIKVRFTAGEWAEPETPPAVPAAPQPETAIMTNESAIRTAADLLERATSLAAVVAGRARDVHPLEAAAARDFSPSGLQSLAGELLGDIGRMQAMAQAAATILAELRSRG